MSPRGQRGFSLVELMIALVLGLVLSAGVIQIYVANKQAYRVADSASRMQENARFAMDFLTRGIRMAGYQGCSGEARSFLSTLDESDADYTDFLYDFSVPLSGFEWDTDTSTWSPALDITISNSGPEEGSDIITVRGMLDGESVSVTGQSAADGCSTGGYESANLKVSDPSGFKDGDIVMVSSCSNAAVFQITGKTGAGSDVLTHETAQETPGNSDKNLGACYVGNELAKITTRSFYIRDSDAGVPSLYRKDGSSAAVELVEGVERMQILYGVDRDVVADGSANLYEPADKVNTDGDWDRVVSVRISLLLRSPENNVVTEPRALTFNGSNVTTERYLWRVYTTTIGLRNRLP